VRQVALGPADGDDVTIERGLAPGDEVVINGADKLREGAKVQVIGASAPPSSSPAPRGRRFAERRAPAP